MDIRYGNHPIDSKFYTTEELRENYLAPEIFTADEIKLTYSHVDRIIFGGIMPVNSKLVLEAGKEMGVGYFLERRELGIIDLGGEGIVTLDGVDYSLDNKDGLYVGMGIKEVVFQSVNKEKPAKYYLNSTPAHATYPVTKIENKLVKPNILGDPKTSNKRTLFQYVHPNICKSCQLLMGMTILDEGSVWNTMPCHTHERRMEVYFYFDMKEDTRVFHMMGQPNETRHIVMANEQAVISPSWSIHSGVGTASYTFIWGMAGENQEFTDMDFVNMKDLK
jgi:4-deoxy-L-threo-5-hexosulose-uronate ketol-isomerase